MNATIVRKATKLAVLPAGLGAGRRRGDVVILLYHRLGLGPAEIELPAAAFDDHLAFLAERGSVIDLDSALAPISPGGVVVTFDDGTPDFHRRALPLLAKHRVPAVLYVATSMIGDGESKLSWSQLREAVSTGLVKVGAHTHDHVDLSRATGSEAEDQMRRCRELVEDRLGVPCRHFAFPWSVSSPPADRVARRLFDSAAVDAWRTNRVGRIDPHRLGRIPILASDGTFFFRRKAAGQLDAEALIYRATRRGPWGR